MIGRPRVMVVRRRHLRVPVNGMGGVDGHRYQEKLKKENVRRRLELLLNISYYHLENTLLPCSWKIHCHALSLLTKSAPKKFELNLTSESSSSRHEKKYVRSPPCSSEAEVVSHPTIAAPLSPTHLEI